MPQPADSRSVESKPATPPALEASIDQVAKRFGTVDALTSLDLKLRAGQITVLLGPNGAGKTTATRLLTGALAPDRGSVTVFGLDPASAGGEQVRRNCGVVSAKPSLYDRLSGHDNLAYAAQLYGLGRASRARNRILEAAEQFGIHKDLDQQVGGYSTGMKTRLALARSILHNPRLLLLDEPTSGLDPESSVAVLGMVRDMADEGRTVMMCTHLLLEAEGLADEVVIVDQGATLLTGAPQELARHYWPNPSLAITAVNGTELDRVKTWNEVIGYRRQGNTATIDLAEAELASDIVLRLSADGIRLVSVVPFSPTLEDLYFAVRNRGAGALPPFATPSTRPSSTPSPTPGSGPQGSPRKAVGAR